MRPRKKHWAIPELKENKYIYFDPIENKGKWKEIFGNDNSIYLELGGRSWKIFYRECRKQP